MDVAAAVAAPRLHHQWLPDEVRIERGFAEDTLAALRAKGHHVIEPLGQTSANSIAVTHMDCSAPPIREAAARGRPGNKPVGSAIAELPATGISVEFAPPHVDRPSWGSAKAGQKIAREKHPS